MIYRRTLAKFEASSFQARWICNSSLPMTACNRRFVEVGASGLGEWAAVLFASPSKPAAMSINARV